VSASESQVIPGAGFGVAVDAQYIYWSTAGHATIDRRLLGGGAVSQVVTGLVYPGHIAVDAKYVYWADVGSQPVSTTPGVFAKAIKSGGSAQPLVTGYHEPTAVGLYNGILYLSVGKTQNVPTSPGEVLMLDLGTNMVTTVASSFGTGQPYPYDATAAANGNIYWVNEGGNSVDYVTSPGGTVYTLTTNTQGPSGLVADGNVLYWTNYSGGTITRYDLDASMSSTPLTGIGQPHGVALDANCLYWARADTGEIWTARKQ
jgi:hypothetical protein